MSEERWATLASGFSIRKWSPEEFFSEIRRLSGVSGVKEEDWEEVRQLLTDLKAVMENVERAIQQKDFSLGSVLAREGSNLFKRLGSKLEGLVEEKGKER